MGNTASTAMDKDVQSLVSSFSFNKKRFANMKDDFRMFASTKEALLGIGDSVEYPTEKWTRDQCAEWWTKMGPIFTSVMAGWSGQTPQELNEKVTKTDTTVDNVKIRVLQAKTLDAANAPTLVYFHGGGFAVWSFEDAAYDNYLTRLAALGTCSIVAVDYVSTTVSPYPAGLNQSIAVTKAAIAGKVPGVSAGKVCLVGDSSGGNVAVCCALKAKREGWLSDISGIYTICPYFDGAIKDPKYPSMMEFDGYFASKGFLIAVVNGLVNDTDSAEWKTNPMAWPIHATTSQLEGLPPTKTVVMELDMIRDMGLAFHYKLQQAKVEASMAIVSGGVHEQQLFTLHAPEVTEASIHDLSSFVRYVSKKK